MFDNIIKYYDVYKVCGFMIIFIVMHYLCVLVVNIAGLAIIFRIN